MRRLTGAGRWTALPCAADPPAASGRSRFGRCRCGGLRPGPGSAPASRDAFGSTDLHDPPGKTPEGRGIRRFQNALGFPATLAIYYSHPTLCTRRGVLFRQSFRAVLSHILPVHLETSCCNHMLHREGFIHG